MSTTIGRRRGWFALALVLAACGKVPSGDDGQPKPAGPAMQGGSGSARMTGGPYVVDVQVGLGAAQDKATGGDLSAEGGAVVTRTEAP